MNCPVCNRENIYELSICISCGAMSIDSVRDELAIKPVSAVKSEIQLAAKTAMKENPSLKKTTSNSLELKPFEIKTEKSAIIVSKTDTAQLPTKQTNPTLIEFHSKAAAVPEWRLKLQNAVRQRQSGKSAQVPINAPQIVSQKTNLRSNGNAALKIETAEQIETQSETAAEGNEVLANALKRINKSRQRFLVTEEEPEVQIEQKAETKPSKVFNFPEEASVNAPAPKMAEPNPAPVYYTKPKLASSSLQTSISFDTNELPPLPEKAQIATSFGKRPVTHIPLDNLLNDDIPAIEKEKISVIEKAEAISDSVKEFNSEIITHSETTAHAEIQAKEPLKIGFIDDENFVEAEETELENTDEIDDCAPFAMRFNAGLFDFIIGSFTTLFLLSPFMILGDNWFSFSGFLTFAVICSIVMFVYLTTAVGLFGRTFGMKLFALEVVDVEGEEYPTFHQSAVSSAVYLLSLPFAGAGFITVLLNDEKRAVHDLVSNTIVVKEY